MSSSCLLLLMSHLHYERGNIKKNIILPEMFKNLIEKIVEKKGNIDTPNTQINHRCFPGFVQKLQSKLAGLH